MRNRLNQIIITAEHELERELAQIKAAHSPPCRQTFAVNAQRLLHARTLLNDNIDARQLARSIRSHSPGLPGAAVPHPRDRRRFAHARQL